MSVYEFGHFHSASGNLGAVFLSTCDAGAWESIVYPCEQNPKA